MSDSELMTRKKRIGIILSDKSMSLLNAARIHYQRSRSQIIDSLIQQHLADQIEDLEPGIDVVGDRD